MNWVTKSVAVVFALGAMATAHAESTIYLDLSKPSGQVALTADRLATFEARLHAYLAARQQPNESNSPKEQLDAIAGEAQMVLDLATDYSALRQEVKNMTRSLENSIPARRMTDPGIIRWDAGAEQMVRVSLQQGGGDRAEAALVHYLLVAMRTDRRNLRDLQKARATLQYQLNVLADDLARYRQFLRGEISDLRAQTDAM